MLGKINTKKLKGFLYFSTSEVYGDPDPRFIPTKEEYNGNVPCLGPRACYDESKRLGETIAASFAKEKDFPITIVRPFNVYGPFMRLNDKRVIPDFVKSGLQTGEIEMFSDGSPTRAFCFVTDAIAGFLRVLLLGKPGRAYNVGNDTTEVSIVELAEKVAEFLGETVNVKHHISDDQDYLTDNPQRRCPNIERAKTELGFLPTVNLNDGLNQTINWYKESYKV